MLRASADTTLVRPSRRVRGRTRVPGDKSISHRYAMLAALADGTSQIAGYSPGADCAATLKCLGALGTTIRPTGRSAYEIVGRGVRGLAESAHPLDCENSGTTMRLMSGLLAANRLRAVLTGDGSLTRRPMRRVIDPLTRMGAHIESDSGRPPLTIHGADLRGTALDTEVPSAQVKSAILLAGLQAAGRSSVKEPAATRDHTERALAVFGVHVEVDGLTVAIEGGQRLSARDVTVPGDVSSAAFWIALAAATPGSQVEIEGVGLNPTRTGMLDVVRRAGARVSAEVQRESSGEPTGVIRIEFVEPRSFEITPAEVPAVIDEIPALAALAALMPPGHELLVRGAAELRVKESDRISALSAGLRALGAQVDEFPDGFRLQSKPLHGATVDAAGDHRLAMAFAIAATGADAPTTIDGASSVGVSYPDFFETLERLTRGDDR
jgi:3-phosphoshikimate 1-carboxyvinyltransferase